MPYLPTGPRLPRIPTVGGAAFNTRDQATPPTGTVPTAPPTPPTGTANAGHDRATRPVGMLPPTPAAPPTIPGNATPPTPPPLPPPATPPVVPPGATTFGPGNDLRDNQINAVDSPDQAQFRDLRRGAADAIATGPSRQEIAQQRLTAFDTAAQPQIRDQLRAVGQRAAALGRVGMGDTEVEAMRPYTDYLTQRAALETSLAADTAEGEIGDRYNRLDAARGLFGDEESTNAGRRDEYRGERGYQQGMSQAALDNAFRGRQLSNQEYEQDMDLWIRQLALSMGVDPSVAYESAARGARR